MESELPSEMDKLSDIIHKGELVFLGNQKLVTKAMIGLNLCAKYFRLYTAKQYECYMELYNLNKNWSKNFVESISTMDLFLVSETLKSNEVHRTASEQLENYYLNNIKNLQYEYINTFKPESKRGLKLLKKLTVDLAILKKKRPAALKAYDKFEKEMEDRERKSMTKEKVGSLVNLSVKTKTKLDTDITKSKKRLQPFLTSYQETLNLINFTLNDFYKVIEYTSEFCIKIKKSELSRVEELKKMFVESNEHSERIVKEVEITIQENKSHKVSDVTNLFEESEILSTKEFGEYDLPISTHELNSLNDSRAVAKHNLTFKSKSSFSEFSVEEVEHDLDEKFANATIALSKGKKLSAILNSPDKTLLEKLEQERERQSSGLELNFRGAEKENVLEHTNIHRPIMKRKKRR